MSGLGHSTLTEISNYAPDPTACITRGRPGCDVPHEWLCVAGILVLLALIGLVVAGAVLLGKRGKRLDAMRADAAVRGGVISS